MAQNQSIIAKTVATKKRLIPDRYPVARRSVFWQVLGNRFGTVVKINVLMVMFFVPSVFWLILNIYNKQGASAFMGFSGNFGFSYPLVTDAAQQSLEYNFNLDMLTNYILLPLLLISAVGLAGGFYALRRLSLGQHIYVVKEFFIGVKKALLPCLLGVVLAGPAYVFLARNISLLTVAAVDAVSIIMLVLSIILLILALSVALFLITHAVSFKAGPWTLIKNSVVFGISMLPTSILFVAIAALPVVLWWVLGFGFALLFLILYGVLGLAAPALTWVLYANYVYTKYYTVEAAGSAPVYKKKERDKRKKPATVKFQNPKKIKRQKQDNDEQSE